MKFLFAFLSLVSGTEDRNCKKEIESVCSELLCSGSGTEGWVIESRMSSDVHECTNHTYAKVMIGIIRDHKTSPFQCILCSTGEGKQHYCRNSTDERLVYEDFDTECQKLCFVENEARFQLLMPNNGTEMNSDQDTVCNSNEITTLTGLVSELIKLWVENLSWKPLIKLTVQCSKGPVAVE